MKYVLVFILVFIGSSLKAEVTPTSVQVISEDEVELALPAWEAHAIGADFAQQRDSVARDKRVKLVTGLSILSLMVYSGFSYYPSEAGQTIIGQLVSGGLFFALGSGLIAGSLGVFQSLMDYIYFNEDSHEKLMKLILGHGTRVCIQKGFKNVTRNTLDNPLEAGTIDPILLRLEDFNQTPIYLDGKAISGQKAALLSKEMTNDKANPEMIHLYFLELYCE